MSQAADERTGEAAQERDAVERHFARSILAMLTVTREVEPLLELQKEFPGFLIWREVTGDRARYVAKRTRSDVSPHTAICATPAELRTVLTGADAPGPRQMLP